MTTHIVMHKHTKKQAKAQTHKSADTEKHKHTKVQTRKIHEQKLTTSAKQRTQSREITGGGGAIG